LYLPDLSGFAPCHCEHLKGVRHSHTSHEIDSSRFIGARNDGEEAYFSATFGYVLSTKLSLLLVVVDKFAFGVYPIHQLLPYKH
jgi:hypothetical protein